MIYVTLAGDRMTVHQRRHVSGPNETGLVVGQLQATEIVDQSSAHPNHPNGEETNAKEELRKHFVIVAVIVLSQRSSPSSASAGTLDGCTGICPGAISRLAAGNRAVAIGFLFALVMVFMLYSLVAFASAKGEEEDGDHFEGNTKLEITWTVIPLITVLVLAVLGASRPDRGDSSPGR